MNPQCERTRDPRHGDFTSNIAMRAAKPLGMQPRVLAAAARGGAANQHSAGQDRDRGAGLRELHARARGVSSRASSADRVGLPVRAFDGGTRPEDSPRVPVGQSDGTATCRPRPPRRVRRDARRAAARARLRGRRGVLRQRCRAADGHSRDQRLAPLRASLRSEHVIPAERLPRRVRARNRGRAVSRGRPRLARRPRRAGRAARGSRRRRRGAPRRAHRRRQGHDRGGRFRQIPCCRARQRARRHQGRSRRVRRHAGPLVLRTQPDRQRRRRARARAARATRAALRARRRNLVQVLRASATRRTASSFARTAPRHISPPISPITSRNASAATIS